MNFNLITVPPDIINDDTSGDLSVSEGENATLWCRATGHPTPRIAWKREDSKPIILRKGPRQEERGKKMYQNRFFIISRIITLMWVRATIESLFE